MHYFHSSKDSPLNISDEAVEAAARAIFAQQYDPEEWELAVNGTLDRCRSDARAALEAATPHLMAQAWQEGHTAGDGDASVMLEARESGRPEKYADVVTPNPYRHAGAGGSDG